MHTRLIIDKCGRVVIPEPLREELHLVDGDSLELDTFGEEIRLRPIREPNMNQRNQGIWEPCSEANKR